MLHWNEKFTTGEPAIDNQHRILIELFNLLDELVRVTNPNRRQLELLWRFIDHLEAYLSEHFQNEAACMYRSRCPAYQQTPEAHSQFLRFFKTFNHRLQVEGYHPAMIKELREICAVWIPQHIMRVDLQLCATPPRALPGP